MTLRADKEFLNKTRDVLSINEKIDKLNYIKIMNIFLVFFFLVEV